MAEAKEIAPPTTSESLGVPSTVTVDLSRSTGINVAGEYYQDSLSTPIKKRMRGEEFDYNFNLSYPVIRPSINVMHNDVSGTPQKAQLVAGQTQNQGLDTYKDFIIPDLNETRLKARRNNFLYSFTGWNPDCDTVLAGELLFRPTPKQEHRKMGNMAALQESRLFTDFHGTARDEEYYPAGVSHNTIPHSDKNKMATVITHGQIEMMVGPNQVTRGQPVIYHLPHVVQSSNLPIIYSPNAPKEKLVAFIGPYNEENVLGHDFAKIILEYKRGGNDKVKAIENIIGLINASDAYRREHAMLKVLLYCVTAKTSIAQKLMNSLLATGRTNLERFIPANQDTEAVREDKVVELILAVEVAQAKLWYEYTSRRCGTANATGQNAMLQINFSL